MRNTKPRLVHGADGVKNDDTIYEGPTGTIGRDDGSDPNEGMGRVEAESKEASR